MGIQNAQLWVFYNFIFYSWEFTIPDFVNFCIDGYYDSHVLLFFIQYLTVFQVW